MQCKLRNLRSDTQDFSQQEYTMSQFKFVSNRSVKNEKGEETGKIKIFVKADSNKAEGDYKCPECLNEGKINQEFSRPFSVICQKCNFKINLPKLKEEMKKEKNAEKKKRQAEIMEQAKKLAEQG